MDWEYLAKHYELLLHQWQLKIEPRLKRTQRILRAKMSILDIELEIKSYELKKGKNKSLDSKKERYQDISSVLDEIGALEDENYNLSLIANFAIQEREVYKQRLKIAEEKFEQYKKAYEEFTA